MTGGRPGGPVASYSATLKDRKAWPPPASPAWMLGYLAFDKGLGKPAGALPHLGRTPSPPTAAEQLTQLVPVFQRAPAVEAAPTCIRAMLNGEPHVGQHRPHHLPCPPIVLYMLTRAEKRVGVGEASVHVPHSTGRQPANWNEGDAEKVRGTLTQDQPWNIAPCCPGCCWPVRTAGA